MGYDPRDPIVVGCNTSDRCCYCVDHGQFDQLIRSALGKCEGNNGATMNRYLSCAFALLLSASTMIAAHGPERRFSIAGMPISKDQIVDARATPGLDGAVSLLLTLEPQTVSAVAKQAARRPEIPISFDLDGKVIGSLQRLPRAAEPIELPVKMSLADAEGLATHISGKPPLPDSLDGEDDGPTLGNTP
jgi:hypothetical protein